MKYVDEFRDGALVRDWAERIARTMTRPWTLMEICGGQTHAIVKYGIDALLPAGLELVHGPGCPVCVTPESSIESALELAARPNVTFCSFGDMLRVPGARQNLLMVKADGGDVRTVYSPLDALEIAAANPQREVVFFAIGFETTSQANAMAVFEARRRGIENFSMLVSQVRVPPAIEAILSDPDNRIQGFLAAGHVCAVMGTAEYPELAARFRTPIVVTGFEPLDLMQGIHACVAQLESGRHEVEIQYRRAVRPEGNRAAQAMLAQVFETIDKDWRGLGVIPSSGLGLRPAFARFDAEKRFDLKPQAPATDRGCRAGDVLRGLLKPSQCPAFGQQCTPEHPLGATMVSSEGACAAYYRFRRHELTGST
ncbi:hydrogenase formation protein HypD [Niveibacterium sp. 24ML]|uniref:hydrogenase formation protein HypD n=1 Tax=Niveibacterium sp. 24ML TaxID=2985512 RepID=UPI002270D3FD|nr:hydrogenase formation protein HypD [Niveibacterium sp. 24ML]MCX9156630.1 hydrogenase formation protein HypD [Niveibacterium sp. 24ML]